MVKLSGFILSALLVVVCLWLSVFSFPDVIRPGDLEFTGAFGAPASSVDSSVSLNSSEANVAAPKSELAPQAEETAPAAKSTSDSPNVSPAKETEPANSGPQKTPANLKSERKSSEVALTDSVDPSEKEQEGEKDALKAGERTRGGRFVSKPAYNLDSFHATVETASTDRVINVTRAKAPVLDASYSR